MDCCVVIIGVGIISLFGNDWVKLWSVLCECKSGIDYLILFFYDVLLLLVGGEVSEFMGGIVDYGEFDKLLMCFIKKGCKLMCCEIEMGVVVV